MLVSTEATFSAAHILPYHEKCSRLHGHNYKLLLEIGGKLDEKGMVIDFKTLDDAVEELVTSKVDHKFIVGTSDVIRVDDGVIKYKRLSMEDLLIGYSKDELEFVPVTYTTAENLVAYFATLLRKRFVEFNVTVTLWETDKHYAKVL